MHKQGGRVYRLIYSGHREILRRDRLVPKVGADHTFRRAFVHDALHPSRPREKQQYTLAHGDEDFPGHWQPPGHTPICGGFLYVIASCLMMVGRGGGDRACSAVSRCSMFRAVTCATCMDSTRWIIVFVRRRAASLSCFIVIFPRTLEVVYRQSYTQKLRLCKPFLIRRPVGRV